MSVAPAKAVPAGQSRCFILMFPARWPSPPMQESPGYGSFASNLAGGCISGPLMVGIFLWGDQLLSRLTLPCGAVASLVKGGLEINMTLTALLRGYLARIMVATSRRF